MLDKTPLSPALRRVLRRFRLRLLTASLRKHHFAALPFSAMPVEEIFFAMFRAGSVITPNLIG